jgi:hypothetical protein
MDVQLYIFIITFKLKRITYNFNNQVLDALTGSCKKAEKEYVAGRMADKLHKRIPANHVGLE